MPRLHALEQLLARQRLASDPEALIPLSGVAEHDYGPGVGRVLELEYSGGDFATMGELARRPIFAASLSHATHGDLARSPRWDEVLRPVGIGDEAIVACRDAAGCWGWLKAYRDGGDAAFGDDELELLADVGPTLGSALRRRFDAATRDASVEAPSSPGVVVLDHAISGQRGGSCPRWFTLSPHSHGRGIPAARMHSSARSTGGGSGSRPRDWKGKPRPRSP